MFKPFKVIVLIVGLGLFGCGSSSSVGEQLFEQGKFQEAIDYYTTQISSGGNVDDYFNRARVYQELRQYENASQDYAYILEKDERNLNARLGMAQVAYETGEYGKSVILCGETLKFNPSSYQAHFLLARSKHQLGYTNGALEQYNAAIALNRDFGEAYLYRGALKFSMRITSACDDLKKAELMGTSGAQEAVQKYCN